MSDADDPLERLQQEHEDRLGTRSEFREQLAELEQQLIQAASRAADAIVPVTVALLDADHDAAADWIRQHHGLATACRALEEAGYVILARQGPVAGDLRRIVTALRNAGDVQRTGDLLRHVASSLQWLDPVALSPTVRSLIAEFGDVVGDIYHGAVQAWRDGDSLAAVDLQRRDDDADRLQRELLTEIHQGRCTLEEAVSLALLARYYERIGDHGVELARGVTYAETGERLTDP